MEAVWLTNQFKQLLLKLWTSQAWSHPGHLRANHEILSFGNYSVRYTYYEAVYSQLITELKRASLASPLRQLVMIYINKPFLSLNKRNVKKNNIENYHSNKYETTLNTTLLLLTNILLPVNLRKLHWRKNYIA